MKPPFDITGLNLRDGAGLAITDGGDRQIEFPLIVTLSIEFRANLFAPFLANTPGTARVAQIGTLERDLQNEMSMLTVGNQVEAVGVVAVVGPELLDELILAADVGGQNEMLQQVLHLLPLLLGEMIKDVRLVEA